MLIDSHCHLDRLDLEPYGGELSAALASARSVGVSHCLCIGIGRANADQVIEISEKYPNVYASVGIHPLEFGESEYSSKECLGEQGIRDWLMERVSHPRVVGVGETGLDYYYSREDISAQQRSFIAHLEVAAHCRKPVIVHSREAREDTIRLVRAHAGPSGRGVLHCFTETWDMAKQALDLGYYISFSGIITFKNAGSLREIASKIPEDRILIETDSPYLAPVPHRGKKNEPKYLAAVATCLAELRGVSVEEIASGTSRNFGQLFGLPLA